jgi:hypothetical protein
MAELNVFKTVAETINNVSADSIYAAPVNYTGIVLSTQVANVDPDSDVSLTFTYHDSASSPGVELLKDFVIPKGDAMNATAGKLVIQTQHYLKMQASKANSLKVVLGVLESLNG